MTVTNKRLLFLITNESEVKPAFNFATAIKKQIPSLISHAVYVKDITKYEIVPTNISGMAIQSSAPLVMGEYQFLEDTLYEEVKKKANTLFDKVYSVTGDSVEAILEEMKAYDALVLVKDETLSSSLIELLKSHYKPLIVLSKVEKEYNLDNVLMLNDGGYNVNRSVFEYFNLFGEKKIDVLRVNVEDRNRLTERFGDVCNVIDKKGEDTIEIITSYIRNYDMILMGDLRYSMLFERITGGVGLKVLESSKNPIFIG